MGLDVLEFSLTVQGSLGLDIPDEEVSAWRTLADVVRTTLPRRPGTGGCPSQRAFHRLRRSLRARGYERQALRPSLRFASVGPRAWEALERETSLVFPPRTLGPVGRAILGSGVIASARLGFESGPWVAAGAGLAATVVANEVDQRLGQHRMSLGELSREVGWRNTGTLGCWSESAIWTVVQHAAALQSGWKRQRCQPGTALADLFPDG
jgi:hypothetical protein